MFAAPDELELLDPDELDPDELEVELLAPDELEEVELDEVLVPRLLALLDEPPPQAARPQVDSTSATAGFKGKVAKFP